MKQATTYQEQTNYIGVPSWLLNLYEKTGVTEIRTPIMSNTEGVN